MEEDSSPDAFVGQNRRITRLVLPMDGDGEYVHFCNQLQTYLGEQSNMLSLEEKKSPLVISTMNDEGATSEISLSVQVSLDSFQKKAKWSPSESLTHLQENQELPRKQESKELSFGDLVDGVGDGKLEEGAAAFGILGDAREEASGKLLNSYADFGTDDVELGKYGAGFGILDDGRLEGSWKLSAFSGNNVVVEVASWKNAAVEEGLVKLMNTNNEEVLNGREEGSWKLSTFSGNNGVVEVESEKNAAVEGGLVKLMTTNSEEVASVEKTNDGLLICSLKIEVIDDTAVIAVSKIAARYPEDVNRKNVGKKELVQKNEKRTRRRVKSGRKDLKGNGNFSNLRGKASKIAYTKKEMEALRYAKIKGQKKMWQEIYNGFADYLRREYDDLNTCREQQYGRLSCDPSQAAERKNCYPGILGIAAARRRGNYLNTVVY